MSTKKKKVKAGDGTVQRPDLAGVHGTGPAQETHRPGEHKKEDSPGGNYTGAHGGTLPRPGGPPESDEKGSGPPKVRR